MEEHRPKGRKKSYYSVWQRAGTGRAKELSLGVTSGGRPCVDSHGSRPAQPSGSSRPVALHTHSYTYVFNRLSHHTHKTQLQRAFCEGLHGAPPAEPNSAFYSELDEQLHLQHRTLAAVRDKLVGDSLVAGGHCGDLDTVATRQAVNSSLSRQMEFFTSCMSQYCGTPAPGPCTCSCAGCVDCSRRAAAR